MDYTIESLQDDIKTIETRIKKLNKMLDEALLKYHEAQDKIKEVSHLENSKKSNERLEYIDTRLTEAMIHSDIANLRVLISFEETNLRAKKLSLENLQEELGMDK